jgi:hypothetical protein
VIFSTAANVITPSYRLPTGNGMRFDAVSPWRTMADGPAA